MIEKELMKKYIGKRGNSEHKEYHNVVLVRCSLCGMGYWVYKKHYQYYILDDTTPYDKKINNNHSMDCEYCGSTLPLPTIPSISE